MTTISTILSIIAILVSIYNVYSQNELSKNINRKNLDALYFNRIYCKALIYKIPKARRKLHIDQDGGLVNDGELREVLNDIRNDSIYYSYIDKKFYDKLVAKLQDLEDYIVRAGNSKILGETQCDFHNEIQIKISNIYNCINDHYKNY